MDIARCLGRGLFPDVARRVRWAGGSRAGSALPRSRAGPASWVIKRSCCGSTAWAAARSLGSA